MTLPCSSALAAGDDFQGGLFRRRLGACRIVIDVAAARFPVGLGSSDLKLDERLGFVGAFRRRRALLAAACGLGTLGCSDGRVSGLRLARLLVDQARDVSLPCRQRFVEAALAGIAEGGAVGFEARWSRLRRSPVPTW